METGDWIQWRSSGPWSSSGDAVSCAGCRNQSIRKAAIVCSNCGERWHTSCAKLTVAQARALTVWHCAVCLGKGPTLSQTLSANHTTEEGVEKDTTMPSKSRPEDMPAGLAQLRASTKVIRLIPKPARAVVADNLSKRINEAVSSTSPGAWWQLFSFAFRVLRSPGPKESKKCSLATLVKRQAVDEDLPAPLVGPHQRHQNTTQDSNSCENVARRVQAKCADGDIGAALRVLTSNESLAPPTEDVIAMLRRKHPSAPEDEDMPPPPSASDSAPLIVTREQVRQSIISMPTGSAGGMDGIRPIHLRQLTSAETGEAGQRLLTSLTSLTNLVLAGQVPPDARDVLYCASLCAFRKKDGGLRPIAVGSVYRRLPARIAARFAASLLGPELRPVQLGVGTPLGCEAAVHAVRSFANGLCEQTPRVLVKLDVKNAFNTVRRDIVLRCIKERCPEVYAMAHQAYITPTPLLMAGHRIMSSTGVQQGDPLGPIAFALAVNSCARSLKSPLNIWYLDDATIGGSVADVVADLVSISRAIPDLGLQLNAAKCEVTVLGNLGSEQHESAIRDVKIVLPEISETPLTRLQLLGSPLHEAGLPNATDTVFDTISRLCQRVRCLDRHTGLFFLAHHVSAPRLIYLLHSTPLYSASSSLRKIDDLVRTTLADVTNVDISGPAWEQASLPRRHGGLGVRSVESLALPCYVTSLCSTAPLISAITTSNTDDVTSAALRPALEELKLLTSSENFPEGHDASKQRLWDDLVCKTATKRLISTANQVDRARLLAASTPHTADWLQALPASNLGLHLDADTVRVAVALRLGASICEPHDCSQCNRPVDRLGHHGLSCRKSAGRFPRHANLNDVVKRALASAGVPTVLEPQGLDRGDGRRPDGLTLFPYKQGKSLTWDATCVDTFAESAVVNSSLEPGSAAMAAEDRKRQRYAAIAQRYIFIPVAVETTGVLGPAAAAFLTDLGRRITDVTGDRREVAWLRQRVSIAVIRGNAAAILAATYPAQGSRTHPLSHQNSTRVPSDKTEVCEKQEVNAPATVERPSRWAEEQRLPDEQEERRLDEPAPPSHCRVGLRSDPDILAPSTTDTGPRRSRLKSSSSETGDGEPPAGQPRGLTGLMNIGNTCFINSILQCLSNTRALHGYILRKEFSSDINTSTSAMKGVLIKEFAALMCDIWKHAEESNRVLTTALLKSQVHRFAPQFMGCQQQDAQEFLRYLLEGLHEDVNRVTSRPKPITAGIDDSFSARQKPMEAWQRFLSLEYSQFVDLFVGQLKSTLQCTVCGHASATFDPFWDLGLPIPSGTDQVRLQACFELFAKEEVLDGDEKPTCSKCRKRQKCTKSLPIQRFPRILVVHLKRFSTQEGLGGKLNAAVHFPVNGLDLSPYSAGQAPCRYDLYGVANHSGTMDSGHYTAHCKHPHTAEWYEFNDSRVHLVNQRSVNSGEAYVLFFELTGTSPAEPC